MRRWPQIVLIIDRGALEQRARRTDKAVVIWIVELPFVIVAENKFVVPPIDRMKIDMWRDQPFLRQEIIERLGREDAVRIPGIGVRIEKQSCRCVIGR